MVVWCTSSWEGGWERCWSTFPSCRMEELTIYMYEGQSCTIIVHHVGKLDACFYDGFLVWVACREREVLESIAVW